MLTGSIVGVAIVDALGGPVEFHRRGTFEKVEKMLPNNNFNLGPG
jgi:ADP-ribosyl-[dinitrogen reductase] hydrolase